MFLKAVKTTTNVALFAIDTAEAAIFTGLAVNHVAAYLFKPLGVAMSVGTIGASMMEEGCSTKQLFKIAGYAPAVLANVAIFALEGTAAVPIVFTAAIAASAAILIAETAYKYKNQQAFTQADWLEFARGAGKSALILATLNVGGTGDIIKRAETTGVTLAQKAVSACAAGFAGIGSIHKFFKSCKTEKSAALDEKDTPLLERELEEGSQSKQHRTTLSIQSL